MSIITNISMDHMQFLGNTPERIAEEKAGIIKPHVPVVIGNASNANVRQVFIHKAKLSRAPIYFASDEAPLRSNRRHIEKSVAVFQHISKYPLHFIKKDVCAFLIEQNPHGADRPDHG